MIIYYSGIERPCSWEMVQAARCQNVMTSYTQLQGEKNTFLELLLEGKGVFHDHLLQRLQDAGTPEDGAA